MNVYGCFLRREAAVLELGRFSRLEVGSIGALSLYIRIRFAVSQL